MTLISKEAFLALDDANYEEVEIAGWGTVRIRSLSGAGRDAYMKGMKQEVREDGTHRIMTDDSEARLLSLTLVDEEGNLWFKNTKEGIQVLRQKTAGSLQKAFFVAMKISGLQSGEQETAAENLDETPSGELGSD